MIYLINIDTHYLFFFLWNIQSRTIQGDCWLYNYTRLIGYCNIVQILRNTIITVTTFVRRSIISHTCQHKGANIASSWSPYKRVSAIYWNQDFYGLIYLIDIYTHDLFYFDEIRNSEQYRVIVGYSPTPGQQVSVISWKYYYYFWINITDFSCYLLFCFHALEFYNTKIQKNNI